MHALTSDNLALTGIRHGFFGRKGGVSEGIYASLNCGYGSGDGRAKVQENRRRVAAHLGAEESNLLICHQVHSATALAVDAPWEAAPPEADALVTRTPGLALSVLTADCAPVLLADAEAGVIAAAHAGWKGALGGVLQSTLARMRALGAQNARIHAAIGPCIGAASYEVGAEFVERLCAQATANRRFFTPAGSSDKAFFDLRHYVKFILQSIEIKNINTIPNDTLAEEASFFSYRRACLRGEGAYGRQISVIMLN